MGLDKIKSSQKLEQILLNFIDVLRINILIVDAKGNPVLVPKTSGHGFQGASQWGTLQYIGGPEFLSKFQTEGHYLKSEDIFGFQSFAIPILIEELNDIGYLILGPVIINKKFDLSLYQTIAKDNELNFSDFSECLDEVRVLTFNSLKSILDLLIELSRYALRMNGTKKPQPAAKKDQTLHAHSIFTNLLDLAMALTQAECGSIMLLNKTTNELSIQFFKGVNLKKFQNAPVKFGEGIAGLAAQQKESFVINEGHSNNRVRHLLKKPELKCALVVPIIKNNNEVLGVMNISTSQGTSLLATHSQQMLKSLTEITSGTFSNIL
jgi:putative methionine-R-sulfoxide reductase with GAF domain